MKRWTAVMVVSIAGALSACQKSPERAEPSASEPARTELLAVGAEAPSLRADAHNGEVVDLAALRGKPVVVYFYPKDDTPGCTVEAQEIRDVWSELKSTGAVVIGVSSDDAASHQAFAEKHALPFLLVPDSDHAIAHKFGVPLTNGKAKRVSFLIGKDGKIAKVFPDVKPQGHGRELLDAVRAAS
jgi:peroxiredoxin Q/BCP